jgi:hypothetical protein
METEVPDLHSAVTSIKTCVFNDDKLKLLYDCVCKLLASVQEHYSDIKFYQQEYYKFKKEAASQIYQRIAGNPFAITNEKFNLFY